MGGGIWISGVVSSSSSSWLEAVAEEAKRQNIPFVGHVPHSVDAALASDLGQRSFEHAQGLLESASTSGEEMRRLVAATVARQAAGEKLTAQDMIAFFDVRKQAIDGYDEALGRKLFARLAKNDTWQCPTLVSNRGLLLAPVEDGFEDDWRLKYVQTDFRASWFVEHPRKKLMASDPEFQRRNFRRVVEAVGSMHESGVRIVAGTDLGAEHVFVGFSLHDELELLVEAGLTPAAALAAATRNPAELLGLQDSLGTIEKGKAADLVLLDADPLTDVTATRQIAGVVVNGRWLDRPALDGLLDQVEDLANP